MIPIALASLVGAGVVGLLGVGFVQLLRRREMTILDHPELPPPATDEREAS